MIIRDRGSWFGQEREGRVGGGGGMGVQLNLLQYRSFKRAYVTFKAE